MQPNPANGLPPVNNDINKNDKNSKNINTLKIITIVTSILAVCGIVFGIYSIVQISQKDNQISSLKAQIDSVSNEATIMEPEKQESENSGEIIDDSNVVENLHMIGDIYTNRRYYLGITDLKPGQDTREKETYIIDTTKLSSGNGIKKYNLKDILDQAESDTVANLPDILAEGTTNATPKSDCDSYKVEVGDPANLPSQADWTIAADWSDKLPLTIYMTCNMKSGGEHSLGTKLYSLNPNTNELTQLVDKFY